MTTLIVLLALLFADQVSAQPAPLEIRVTGEHISLPGETSESARQLALADGRRKAWTEAVSRLQRRSDVKELALKPEHLEVYTVVLLEIAEPPAAVPPPAAPGKAMQIRVGATLDPGKAVTRMRELKKDQDATRELVAAWTRMQRQHQRLAELNGSRARATASEASAIRQEQERIVTTLRAAHLATRATAALARTVEATVGGRTPSREGKDEAQRLVDTALAISPGSADARTVLGDLLVEAERPDAAEAEFRLALMSEPGSVPIRTKLAEALRLQGNFAEAIAELREAFRLDASFAQAHADLGMILRAEKNFTEAVAEYREAIRLDPDSIDAHNGLAVTFANQGRLEDAVAEFREIIRIDRDSAMGYYNLAYALAELDRDEESAAALREVVRINPNHYNARFNLGELFRLEGKYDDSVTQFREYLRLAPDQPQNQRNIQRARSYIAKFAEQ